MNAHYIKIPCVCVLCTLCVHITACILERGLLKYKERTPLSSAQYGRKLFGIKIVFHPKPVRTEHSV